MKAIAQSGFFYANDGGVWNGLVTDKLSSAAGGLTLSPLGGGFETRGAFLGGPYEALDGPTPWFRIEPSLELPGGTHLQLYTFTSDGPAPAVALSNDVPFAGYPLAYMILADGAADLHHFAEKFMADN